ncbi:hypothetical protein ACP3T3_15035 [Chryseobacterium sp. CBSDS_008]|uniref:hypothetical protein n=1 Tax=Chryseobacterium sp. CBSDS_008 TaxID=3415265 RepID=UPI003CEAA214
MQNNNYEGWNEILFDEWQGCIDKDLFPDEKIKPGAVMLPVFIISKAVLHR